MDLLLIVPIIYIFIKLGLNCLFKNFFKFHRVILSGLIDVIYFGGLFVIIGGFGSQLCNCGNNYEIIFFILSGGLIYLYFYIKKIFFIKIGLKLYDGFIVFELLPIIIIINIFFLRSFLLFGL